MSSSSARSSPVGARRRGRRARHRRPAARRSRSIQKLHDATGVRAGAMTLGRLERDAISTPRRRRHADRRRHGRLRSRCFATSVIFLDYRRLGDRRRRTQATRVAQLPAGRALPAARRARSRSWSARMTLGESAILVLLVDRRAVPDHRGRRAQHGARAGALDHELGPRAVHGHRARPAGRLRASHQHRSRRISSASWRESFNQMTGSIEDLLQTAAEKKRLEEELRIARADPDVAAAARAARRARASP